MVTQILASLTLNWDFCCRKINKNAHRNFVVLIFWTRVNVFATPLNQDPATRDSCTLTGRSYQWLVCKVLWIRETTQNVLEAWSSSLCWTRDTNFKFRAEVWEDSNLLVFESGSFSMPGRYYVLHRFERFQFCWYVVAVWLNDPSNRDSPRLHFRGPRNGVTNTWSKL